MSEDRHSQMVSGRRAYWMTKRLWELSDSLPVVEVAVADLAELDQDCWFDGQPATCRMVAEHARRIQDADLDHPIVLSADGGLMDGGHRVAKAWLAGHRTIRAVRFPEDPQPDYWG